jgi:hypothetical protein
VGGDKEKKVRNQLATQAMQKSGEDYTRYGAQFESDRASAQQQLLTSRNTATQATTDMGNRDYNSYNNPDVATARAGYNDFATTGGLSAGDRETIRRNATGYIPGLFTSMSQEADRAATRQGGYGPGTMALKSRLLRERAKAAGEGNLAAEGLIADKVREGRMYGTSGLATLGRETADRNLQRDATTLASRNQILQGDRGGYDQAAARTLANRQAYYDSILGGANAGGGGGRDWLGTSLAIAGTGASIYGNYAASR